MLHVFFQFLTKLIWSTDHRRKRVQGLRWSKVRSGRTSGRIAKLRPVPLRYLDVIKGSSLPPEYPARPAAELGRQIFCLEFHDIEPEFTVHLFRAKAGLAPVYIYWARLAALPILSSTVPGHRVYTSQMRSSPETLVILYLSVCPVGLDAHHRSLWSPYVYRGCCGIFGIRPRQPRILPSCRLLTASARPSWS